MSYGREVFSSLHLRQLLRKAEEIEPPFRPLELLIFLFSGVVLLGVILAFCFLPYLLLEVLK